MAGAVTYFGDVLTVGNTKIVQNLYSKGIYSIFNGNVNPAVTATTSFGVSSGTIYSTNSNTITLNVTSIYGPESLGAFTGNAWVSNSVASQNVLAITSANATILNTAAIFGIYGKVGVNCVPTLTGPNLNIVGNVYDKVFLSGTNVFATTSANVATLNTSAVSSTLGFLGLNCEGGGATLNVAGNVYVSNTLTATNVLATTSANGASLGTSTITGFVGINGGPGGATLNVAGNVYVSNALTVKNVLATTSSNLATLNTSFISGFVGMNCAPGGAVLSLVGNVLVSNTLTTTNVLPITSANLITSSVTYMNSINYGVGINTPAQAGSAGGLVLRGSMAGTASVAFGNAPTSNTALSIPDVNSFVGLGSSSTMGSNPLLRAFFVEAWVYFTAGFTGTANIASVGDVNTAGWALSAAPAVGVTISVSGGFKTNAVTIPLGTWFHAAGAMDGTGASKKLHAFYNGVVSSSGGNSGLFNLTDPAYIGARNGVGGGAGYYIRDVRVCYAANNPVGATFTPESAPFSTTTCPTYAFTSGGTVAYTLYPNFSPAFSVKIGGNVWSSNAIQSIGGVYTNVTARTTNCRSIFSGSAGGIGVYQVPVTGGASLQINGNVFASNALQSATILAPTANTLTANLKSIFRQSFGVNKAVPTSNLDVDSNIYVSNSITTASIFCTNSNASVANVTRIVGKLGPVGVGTIPIVGGANLQVTGDLYASNALSATTISMPYIQTYNEDLTRRSPYLTPDNSNAAAIQTWITASCNATQQVGWSSSAFPAVSNIVTNAPTTGGYSASVFLPDGRVLFVPFSSSNIGFFNPKTSEFSTLTVPSIPVGNSTYKFGGGVLAPNGSVIFIPYSSSNICSFNPVSKVLSNVAQVDAAAVSLFSGGVLAPNGNVVCIPYSGSNIGIFNPITTEYSNAVNLGASPYFQNGVLTPNGNVIMAPESFGNVGVLNPVSLSYSNVQVGSFGFSGAVLAPNGNVIMVPFNSANVGVFNPTNSSFSNVAVGGVNIGFFNGGALLPTGNIIMAPYNSANIGMFNPTTLTFSNSTPVGGGPGLIASVTLVPDGRAIMCPINTRNVIVVNTTTPASRAFCLSPYFNKW